MDNAFPQVRNLEKMYDMKVYGAGTMRPHFGFPPELHELVRKLNDKNSPLDVGKYEWMMAPLGDDREASFLAVVWRDVGYVKFISTFHSLKEVLIYRRQPGKSEKDERSCIEGIKDYNQNMGGTPPRCCGIIIRRMQNCQVVHALFFDPRQRRVECLHSVHVISGMLESPKEADPTPVHHQGSGGASRSRAE